MKRTHFHHDATTNDTPMNDVDDGGNRPREHNRHQHNKTESVIGHKKSSNHKRKKRKNTTATTRASKNNKRSNKNANNNNIHSNAVTLLELSHAIDNFSAVNSDFNPVRPVIHDTHDDMIDTPSSPRSMSHHKMTQMNNDGGDGDHDGSDDDDNPTNNYERNIDDTTGIRTVKKTAHILATPHSDNNKPVSTRSNTQRKRILDRQQHRTDPSIRFTSWVNSVLSSRVSKASAYGHNDLKQFVDAGNNTGATIPARIPNLGTNIDDIRRKIDFHDYGTRYMLIGLNHECHAFLSLHHLLRYIESEASTVPNRSIKQFLNESETTVWIDVQKPSHTDMQIMEKSFGIHPLTSEDIMLGQQESCSEKWEMFAEYMFVVFLGQLDDELPMPQELVTRFNTSNETQLCILVFENYVLTIHEFPIKGLDVLMRRIEVEYELDLGRSKTEIEKLMSSYDEQRMTKQRAAQSLSSKSTKVSVIQPNGTSSKRTGNSSGNRHDSSPSLTSSSSSSRIPVPDDHRESPLLPDIYVQMDDSSESAHSAVAADTHHSEGDPHVEASVTTNYGQVSMSRDADTVYPKSTTIPSSDWILYAFLDAVVDMYIPTVNSLIFEVEHIDEMVYELEKEERQDLLKRIGLAKKNTVSLGRLLVPKRKITNELIEHQSHFLTTNVQFYLRDIIDHLEICLERLDVARQNLAHAHHNYLTKVQMEIVEASGRTDAFMNRLSILALLFTPPTVLAGIFGMNVQVIGQADHYDNLYPFFGILTFMAVFFLVTIILLRNQLV